MKKVRLFVAVCLTVVMFVSIVYAANEICVNGQKTTVEEENSSFDTQGRLHTTYETTVTINSDATCVSVEFSSTCVTNNVSQIRVTVRLVIKNTSGAIVYDSTSTTSAGPLMKVCNN
jgi:hypothetical protein